MVVKKQPKKNKKEEIKKEKLSEENFKENSEEKIDLDDFSQEEGEEVEKTDETKKEEDSLKDLTLKIIGLEKELGEFKEANLRLKAEFDNYKKRTQKEKASIYDMAKSDSVLPFLEVLDNLERAVNLVEEKNKFSEGIDLVVNKFYDVLKKVGIVEIESLGKVFDPNFHEAIKVVKDDSLEKNVVCEVFQKGFKLNDVVVRHALVVVANP